MIINENWKIESDTNNIILFQARKITGTGKGRPTTKKIGEVYWMPVAYVQSFQEAISSLIRREVRSTELKDLETINSKFKELEVLVNSLKTPPDFVE